MLRFRENVESARAALAPDLPPQRRAAGREVEAVQLVALALARVAAEDEQVAVRDRDARGRAPRRRARDALDVLVGRDAPPDGHLRREVERPHVVEVLETAGERRAAEAARAAEDEEARAHEHARVAEPRRRQVAPRRERVAPAPDFVVRRGRDPVRVFRGRRRAAPLRAPGRR